MDGSYQEIIDLSMDKKSYDKIDPIGKLHIISSLDSGQSKTNIAKQYNVDPQTITFIYKQRELILKKYTQIYHQLKEIDRINLDQSLLNWLNVQIFNRTPITEENLLGKAQEMTSHLNKKSICIEDWLLDFQLRHNIVKYSPDIQHDSESLEEWNTFLNDTDAADELYVCGTCAISHSFTIDNFAAGELPNDYMSIFFIVHALGHDKRKIALVGRDPLMVESNVGSIPVNYYCNNGQVNYKAIINHLNKWDIELESEGKTVSLIMNLNMMMDNGYLNNFNHIRIINSNMTFLTKALDKIVECFKYHYRKLQLSKRIDSETECQFGLLDYINMISLSWFNVSNSHVKHIFFPPNEGSLYIRPNDTCNGDHSIRKWCQTYNIPLNLKLYSHCIDMFIWCDRDIKSFDIHDCTDSYEFNTDGQSSSSMEAYQAIKRLLSYVHGESASENVLKSAKHLDNHLEYEALLEIHKAIDANNSLE